MKLVYIAGPFNARSGVSMEENIRYVEWMAGVLVRLFGDLVQPVVPHSLGRALFGIQTEAAAYAGTLELMRRCDAVLFSCSWAESKGARAEREAAERLGLPIFDDKDMSNVSDPIGHWLRTGERL